MRDERWSIWVHDDFVLPTNLRGFLDILKPTVDFYEMNCSQVEIPGNSKNEYFPIKETIRFGYEHLPEFSSELFDIFKYMEKKGSFVEGKDNGVLGNGNVCLNSSISPKNNFSGLAHELYHLIQGDDNYFAWSNVTNEIVSQAIGLCAEAFLKNKKFDVKHVSPILHNMSYDPKCLKRICEKAISSEDEKECSSNIQLLRRFNYPIGAFSCHTVADNILNGTSQMEDWFDLNDYNVLKKFSKFGIDSNKVFKSTKDYLIKEKFI